MKSGAEAPAAIDPAAIALAYLVALGGDDPAAVIALVADDFANEHIAELASGSRGRDAYARRLPGFFEAFPNRRYTVEHVAIGELAAARDDRSATEVIVEYRFGADVDGTRIDLPGIMWISVSDGEVTRRLDSWDSLTYHRQTGTPVDG